MLIGTTFRPQDLSFYSSFSHNFNHNLKPFLNPDFSTCPPFFSSALSLNLSSSHHHRHYHRRNVFFFLRSLHNSLHAHQRISSFRALNSLGTSAEQLVSNDENWDFSTDPENFKFDGDPEARDLKHLDSPDVEVKELDELPEQWRRARLAWLCKQLPAYKSASLVKILNGQKKWMRQDDATYIVVHCIRIRENDAAFKAYKWMMQQSWYKFDFSLSTKLADFLGKERKFSKCREMYDDIINQGRVPSESTFHILIIAYLSAPVQGCLEEACTIYNRMIQLGGYQPRLSLHNSLFKALVSKPGLAKQYLKQAEFIYHNLVTSGFEIQKDIYGGLMWLHSYQDNIDKERIASIREEMKQAGIEEGKDILVSILRACSKEGDEEEAEKTWVKLLKTGGPPPSQAFVYMIEVFAKLGEHKKSLQMFRKMQEHLGSASVAAYHKIIEVLSEAQEVELADSLFQEFIGSDMKPLQPPFSDLMSMYLNLNMHDKLESAFSACAEKCQPNRNIYNIYLDSLVKVGKIEKVEETFNNMLSDEAVGVNARSCNAILSGYLSSGKLKKAEKVYDLMCQKKYDIEPSLIEKLDHVLSSSRKVVKKPLGLKLTINQREILVGLFLGGFRMDSGDYRKKKRMILFEFNENSSIHSILRRHLYDEYHEWLHPSCKLTDGSIDVSYKFSTISHTYFSFYAEQFWPQGKPMIPKLIHRWLSPQVLAYWYMYGGHITSSGDIILKLKGNKEGVEKVLKTLKAKSLNFRVKRKGRTFWIGFLGNDSMGFWKLVEPYVLDGLKSFLRPSDQISNNSTDESKNINFESGSDSADSENDTSS